MLKKPTTGPAPLRSSAIPAHLSGATRPGGPGQAPPNRGAAAPAGSLPLPAPATVGAPGTAAARVTPATGGMVASARGEAPMEGGDYARFHRQCRWQCESCGCRARSCSSCPSARRTGSRCSHHRLRVCPRCHCAGRHWRGPGRVARYVSCPLGQPGHGSASATMAPAVRAFGPAVVASLLVPVRVCARLSPFMHPHETLAATVSRPSCILMGLSPFMNPHEYIA